MRSTMASTGATSVTSRPIRSSILPNVASKWSRPASRRPTASFKLESELLRSPSVSPRPPNTSSSCPTVTSAFIAAWVSVLIRCRGERLPALLSAMTLIMAGREPPESITPLIGYAPATLRSQRRRADEARRTAHHHPTPAGLCPWLCRSAGRAALLIGRKFACCLRVEKPDRALATDRAGRRHRHRVGAADRGGYRFGFLRARHQQPDLEGPLDCRQRQGNSRRRRLR